MSFKRRSHFGQRQTVRDRGCCSNGSRRPTTVFFSIKEIWRCDLARRFGQVEMSWTILLSYSSEGWTRVYDHSPFSCRLFLCSLQDCWSPDVPSSNNETACYSIHWPLVWPSFCPSIHWRNGSSVLFVEYKAIQKIRIITLTSTVFSHEVGRQQHWTKMKSVLLTRPSKFQRLVPAQISTVTRPIIIR